MKGYFGKFLKINLTSGQTSEMPISETDQEKYIGGSTLAAKIIYDYVKPGMDPLSPENPIIFNTGPFTGSNVPMVSRAAICGISPGTGLWGEATTGGKFPMRLKGTGYDGIIITGKAKKQPWSITPLDKNRARPVGWIFCAGCFPGIPL